MRKYLWGFLLLACLCATASGGWAQDLQVSPTPQATASAVPVEVNTEVKVELEQPVPLPESAPAPAPAPDVNIQLHEAAPAVPAVVKSESNKETSVTRIVQSAPPDDSKTNLGLLLLGGLGLAVVALALASVSKRRSEDAGGMNRVNPGPP